MENLEGKIRNIIRDKGSLTIAEYMRIALCDEEFGYYKKAYPVGKDGDFITAPEISQIFGELMGVWLATTWEQLQVNGNIMLVEAGAGRGVMMKDILRTLQKVPELYSKLTVHIIEINEQLIELQKANLADFGLEIKWHKDFSTLPDRPILFVANEFFDALPIHQYIKEDDGWYERIVTIDKDDNLCFSVEDSTSDIDIVVEKNSIYETCPEAINIIIELSEQMNKFGGAALIIDYGYSQATYKDSFQAVKNHTYHNPLKDIGEADLTAHVDFIALKNAAEKVGAKTSDIITQRDFLLSMGVEIRARKLSQSGGENILSDVNRLIDPKQMGTLFKCISVYQAGK